MSAGENMMALQRKQTDPTPHISYVCLCYVMLVRKSASDGVMTYRGLTLWSSSEATLFSRKLRLTSIKVTEFSVLAS